MPLSEARPSWRVLYWVLWAVRLAAAFAFLWAVDFNIDGSPHVAILLAAYVGFIAGGLFKSVVEFIWEVSDRRAPTRWWSAFAFPIVVMLLIFFHNEVYHWTRQSLRGGPCCYWRCLHRGACGAVVRALSWAAPDVRRIALRKFTPHSAADKPAPIEIARSGLVDHDNRAHCGVCHVIMLAGKQL